MSHMQDLYYDHSIDDDDDYVGESDDADGSSDDDSSNLDGTDNEPDTDKSASHCEDEGAVVSQPARRAATSGRAASSSPRSTCADGPIEEQEAIFTKALRGLETPEEVRRCYPPRFAANSSRAQSQNTSESQILDDFILLDNQDATSHDLDRDSEPDSMFNEFELHEFCVYQSPNLSSGTERRGGLEGRYEGLHVVSNNLKDTTPKKAPIKGIQWRIDGLIKHETTSKSFVRGHIVEVSVGGAEDLEDNSATDSIWVQTAESRSRDYWYRLKKPLKPYQQYWVEFVWLANFTKYVIDFLHVNSTSGKSVCLATFREEFWQWLDSVHGRAVSEWHAQSGKRVDFRQHVLSHFEFLRNQVGSLEKKWPRARFDHQIWDDIAAGEAVINRQKIPATEKTVVTRHVADTFLTTFPYWQKELQLLEIVEKCPEVEEFGARLRNRWEFPNKLYFSQSANFRLEGREQVSKAAWILQDAGIENRPVSIKNPQELLRAVVVIREWNHQSFRYAWVQAVSKSTISVVWLVLPTDTLCGDREEMTFYPIGNELFFSDECNCKPVSTANIVKVINTSVFTDHAEDGAELFAHGLFRQTEEIHVKAVESELPCHCQKSHRAPKKSISQEFSPSFTQKPPKMKVVALCGGCGLLDHAFCSAASAETCLVVEYNEAAARSHEANNPSRQCRYLRESVNPVLRRFMTGEERIPEHIGCLIAGCPCQGWSALNQNQIDNKEDDLDRQKNCSLLANMMSWVEVFMPPYVLLENVLKMDTSRPSACAQAICYLVALGYQVRKSIRVDCDVGGVSIRKRVFIIAAAPGAVLPAEIPITHGNSLAQKHRTAWSAIQDLRPIENDTMLNHEDPEHVPWRQATINWDKGVNFRSLILKIQTFPKIATSLSKAYHAGKLSKNEREFFKTLSKEQRRPASNSYKRIGPNKPFRTIATSSQPMDARSGGQILHPFQNRLLSLREISRAMRRPDWFLLAGTINQKHHQMGNGVPWALGEGWGEVYGQAWRQTIINRARESQFQNGNDVPESHNQEVSTWTASTTSEASFHSHRHSSSLKTTSEATTIFRKQRLRRVISSDDESETDAQVQRPVSEVRVKYESTITVRSRSTPRTEPATPLQQFDSIVEASDENYFSAQDEPAALKVAPVRKRHARAIFEEKALKSTPPKLLMNTKQARTRSKAQPATSETAELIDLTISSDDEVPTTKVSLKTAVRKRRAPEGPEDLSDDEVRPVKKR